MSILNCWISNRKKREILKRMRNAEIFDKEYPAETLRVIKKYNPRMQVILKWFYEKTADFSQSLEMEKRFLIRRRVSKESKA